MKHMKTIKNVELMRAGVEYNLSTGKKTFTPEMLRDVVMAANEDPSIPSPRLKIGHNDPRFNNHKIFDGSPSFGMAKNLRLSSNGMSVLADYEGVPSWLAELLPVAYPSRSIEGWDDVESQMGKEWKFVLTACSLLGVTWPGITVLEDLPLYYGDEVPVDVQVDPDLANAARQYAGLVAASSSKPGGGPNMQVTASANLDDVRRAFYSTYIPSNPDASYLWICAVLTDPNQLVVEDDESGQLYLLPFESDASGNVSFGQAEPVRVDYVPEDRDAQKAAASHVAATLCAGRQVLASWPTRAASRPDNAPGGRMDPKLIRQALGLAEDASDEEVQAALRAQAGIEVPAGETTPPAPDPQTPPAPAPETPTPAPAPTPTPTPAPTPTTPPAPEQRTPEQIAASHGLNLPEGTVLVDEATLASFRTTAERLDRMEAREADTERTGLVAAAIDQGRIPPSRRDYWLEYLKRDLEGGKQVLASFPANIVPLHERGHGITPSEDAPILATALDDEVVSTWSAELFSEVRSARERDAIQASGGGFGPRSRIQADASYRR